MGEGVAADVGLGAVGRAVEQLVDEVRGLGEVRELLVGQHAAAHLQLQVGDDRDEVGVAGALPHPVHRALDLARADLDGGQRVGHAALGVVVAVDGHADAVADGRDHGRRSPRRPAAAATSRWCRRGRPSRRPRRPPRAGSPARSPRRRGSRRRSARRRRRRACPPRRRKATDSAIMARFSARSTRTTFSRCRPHVLPTIVHTGAKHAGEHAQALVLGGRHAAPARHAEGGDVGVLEALLGEQLEELELLGVRRREAGLDEVDARARRACARRAPSRPPTASGRGPACHRAAWRRRAGCRARLGDSVSAPRGILPRGLKRGSASGRPGSGTGSSHSR